MHTTLLYFIPCSLHINREHFGTFGTTFIIIACAYIAFGSFFAIQALGQRWPGVGYAFAFPMFLFNKKKKKTNRTCPFASYSFRNIPQFLWAVYLSRHSLNSYTSSHEGCAIKEATVSSQTKQSGNFISAGNLEETLFLRRSSQNIPRSKELLTRCERKRTRRD